MGWLFLRTLFDLAIAVEKTLFYVWCLSPWMAMQLCMRSFSPFLFYLSIFLSFLLCSDPKMPQAEGKRFHTLFLLMKAEMTPQLHNILCNGSDVYVYVHFSF